MTTLAKIPNLAFVSHKFQRNDGQGRVNYEVVKAALAQGYRVTVLATDCATDISAHPAARFVKIGTPHAPTELLRNLMFARQSARWLRQHRADFDIVQANGFVTWEKADVVAAHFIHSAWLKNSWYPFRSLHPYSLYQRLYTTLNASWEKAAYTRAQRVIAVSRPLVAELVEIGVEAENIDVILNGVDTQQFEPGEPDRGYFGLPEGVPIALFVGDIRTPRKNLETVLNAMQAVPNLSLAVAGGVKGSPYPALARDLGLAARVIFLDKVDRMPLLMRSADLFVFPSRYEAHPLVLLEAMASGLPSIVSGTFGAEAFLGDAGIILRDPNSAQELAGTVNDLLQSPWKLAAMSKSGRDRALEMRWSRMAESYLQVYEKFWKQSST